MQVNHKIAKGVVKWYMNTMSYSGWTSYWNTIYYIDFSFMKNTRLRKHELKHIEQMKREGKFVFTVKYLWEYIRVGYYDNKFEVEARKAENE